MGEFVGGGVGGTGAAVGALVGCITQKQQSYESMLNNRTLCLTREKKIYCLTDSVGSAVVGEPVGAAVVGAFVGRAGVGLGVGCVIKKAINDMNMSQRYIYEKECIWKTEGEKLPV